VTVCHMQGHNTPKLNEESFRKAIRNPIGTPPIRELARNKKSVVILFDDLSRPTKAAEIVPFVLEELAAGGVEEKNIQFICALGAHGAMTAIEFTKKLGADILARFNVYNHNTYENCTYIGKTTRGTPVSLNTEFLNADLKIGIGSIVPHQSAGFGGGAKIILPAYHRWRLLLIITGQSGKKHVRLEWKTAPVWAGARIMPSFSISRRPAECLDYMSKSTRWSISTARPRRCASGNHARILGRR